MFWTSIGREVPARSSLLLYFYGELATKAPMTYFGFQAGIPVRLTNRRNFVAERELKKNVSALQTSTDDAGERNKCTCGMKNLHLSLTKCWKDNHLFSAMAGARNMMQYFPFACFLAIVLDIKGVLLYYQYYSPY